MGKFFKDMKMGVKIGSMVSLILILSLLSIMIITVKDVRNNTQRDSEHRLGELANARASYVDSYLNQYQDYFKGVATMPVVVDALQNPEDPEKVALAQAAVEAYAASRPDMEGVFVATPDTTILCHSVAAAVGSQISDDPNVWEDRKNGVNAAPNNV